MVIKTTFCDLYSWKFFILWTAEQKCLQSFNNWKQKERGSSSTCVVLPYLTNVNYYFEKAILVLFFTEYKHKRCNTNEIHVIIKYEKGNSWCQICRERERERERGKKITHFLSLFCYLIQNSLYPREWMHARSSKKKLQLNNKTKHYEQAPSRTF